MDLLFLHAVGSERDQPDQDRAGFHDFTVSLELTDIHSGTRFTHRLARTPDSHTEKVNTQCFKPVHPMCRLTRPWIDSSRCLPRYAALGGDLSPRPTTQHQWVLPFPGQLSRRRSQCSHCRRRHYDGAWPVGFVQSGRMSIMAKPNFQRPCRIGLDRAENRAMQDNIDRFRVIWDFGHLAVALDIAHMQRGTA
jgi:hypothetical protein